MAAQATTPPLTLSQALNLLVRELLAERGWSQATLADRLEVDRSAVSHRLRREAKELEFYQDLARAFDMPLSELFRQAEARQAASRAGQGKRPKRVDPAQVPSVNELKWFVGALKQIEQALVDLGVHTRTRRTRRRPRALGAEDFDPELRQHLDRQTQLLAELHEQRQAAAVSEKKAHKPPK